MTIIRRSAGLSGLVLAVVGLLACLSGAAGVWLVKNRMQDIAAAVYAAADDAYEFMSTRLLRVEQRLEAGRERVATVSDQAERLRTIMSAHEPEPEAHQPDAQSLRATLDTMVQELRGAADWLDSIEAVARGVQSAAAAIADAPADRSQSTDDRHSERAAQIAELAADLASLVDRLDALRTKLAEARESRVMARELAGVVIAEVTNLDSRLSTLSTAVRDLATRTSEARERSIAHGRRVQGWITLSAIALMFVLLWFAASQLCVLNRSWKIWRSE